jgi:hypothetical protein
MSDNEELAPIPQPLEEIFEPRKEKALSPYIFILIIFVAFSVLLVIPAIPILIAYQVVPIGNIGLQQEIENRVFQLSFLPKSSSYILRKVQKQNEKIMQFSLDTELEVNMDSLQTITSNNEAKAKIKGVYDRQNMVRPLYYLNIIIDEEFNIDLQQSNKNRYLRINSLPDYAEQYLRIGKEDFSKFTAQWVSLPLLVKPDNPKMAGDLEYNNSKDFENYLEKNIFPKAKMENSILEGQPFYKFNVNLTQEEVDEVRQLLQKDYSNKTKEERKLNISDLSIEIWANAESYYIEQVVFGIKGQTNIPSSSFSPSPEFSYLEVPSLSDQNVLLTVSMNLDNFNKEIKFQPPAGAITLDQYTDRIDKVLLAKEALEESNAEKLKGTAKYEELKSMLALETAILHYYYDHDSMPRDTQSLLNSPQYFEGELKVQVQKDLEEENIRFIPSGDGKSIFIVTVEGDVRNEAKPYRGIIVYTGQSSKLQNLSRNQVDMIINSLGILNEEN